MKNDRGTGLQRNWVHAIAIRNSHLPVSVPLYLFPCFPTNGLGLLVLKDAFTQFTVV